ncbi:MAG: 2-oxo acid dehydrogenase subunit E2, partial [Candidatus Ranarchaeia archaeon]
MAKIVRLHKIGETMTEGIITQWFQKEGSTLKKGDPLFEVETEKLTTTIESVDEGVLLKIITPAGKTVPIGAPLAVVGEAGEQIPPLDSIVDESGQEGPPPETIAASTPASRPSPGGRVRISPVARKLAIKHNIDISSLKGSGPGGRFVIEDVQKAIGGIGEQKTTGIKPSRIEPLSQLRKTIARNLKESIDNAVHSTLTSEVQCDALVAYRNEIVDDFEKKHGFRVTYTDLLLRFTVESLKLHPLINASYSEDGIK